jgi:hypothetical protein
MKFDTLIEEILNEARIQDHGKVSPESALANAKTNAIEIFERTHDPRELIYVLNNPYVEVNFEGRKLTGDKIKEKIKSVYFTKGSNKFIKIPKFEEGFGSGQTIPDQEDILIEAKRKGKVLRTEYPEFSKTAGYYKDWRVLLLLLSSDEEKLSANARNISQEVGGGEVFMDYINANNTPRNALFYVKDPVYNESGKIVDGKITKTPFGGKGGIVNGKPVTNSYSDPDIRPLALRNTTYEQFISELRAMGGNFKSILELCDGEQGTKYRKNVRRPSLKQSMQQQQEKA